MENKIKALSQHLECEVDEITQSKYDDNVYEFGKDQEYLVVTDDEGDEYWNEDLENYIDECILPELPEQYHNYFDSESWKADARYDGRGHSLNRYDGTEYEEEVEGETYYIYRQN
jgi:hypothetical protein